MECQRPQRRRNLSVLGFDYYFTPKFIILYEDHFWVVDNQGAHGD